jgi:uncharacterized membrane protein
MDRCFILAGLFLNIIGVLLIFFGARPYKDFPIGAQTSSKDTGYLTIIRDWILRLGLILIIAGLILQMVGVFIK